MSKPHYLFDPIIEPRVPMAPKLDPVAEGVDVTTGDPKPTPAAPGWPGWPIYPPYPVPQVVDDAKEIQAAIKKAKASRGYAMRSFNQYNRSTTDLLAQRGDAAAPPDLRNRTKIAYIKAKVAFEKMESFHYILISYVDEDDLDEVSVPMNNALADFARLTTEMEDWLDTPPQVEVPVVPIVPVVPAVVLPPSQRFRGAPVVGEPIDPHAMLLLEALAQNYDVLNHVITFDGSDTRKYKSFRLQWELVDRQQEKLGKSGFDKLMLLKKCLKSTALKMILYLPDIDGSYEAALQILDDTYYNNQSNIQMITVELKSLPKMESSLNSMQEFYSKVNQIYQSIQAVGLGEDQLGTSLFLSHVVPKLSSSTLRQWTKLQRTH